MKSAFDLSKFIEDIELNGLKGRMINVPATHKSAQNLNILLFHGQHSSLERMSGVAELLSDYGNFCLPDMPGFGGMDPLYNIGLEPSLDNLADYMAAFIKLHYGSKNKFVVVGYSFGFLVLTRMLQKYPQLQKQVVETIGLGGFVHNDAFLFSKRLRLGYTILSYMMLSRLGSFIAREVIMRKWFIGTIHANTRNAKIKYSSLSKEEYKRVIDFEVHLWRCNDVRTRGYTVLEMLKADLMRSKQKIDSSMISISIGADHYFDGKIVEQQLKFIFSKVKTYRAVADVHSMSVASSAKDVEPYFPKPLRAHLRSLR